jgi:IclR family transcriptional regulator, pca regulon regulatory protein
MDDYTSPHSLLDERTDQPDFVTALSRGLSVIRAFGPETPRMTLAEVARKVGLPRATVRRSLITLETLGYAESDRGGFSLTPKILTLGQAYLSSSPLTVAAKPLVERLAERLHETCWAGILDEGDVLLIVNSRTSRILSAGLSVGSRLPAYCSALGRVLLAALPDEELDTYLTGLSPKQLTPRTLTDAAQIRHAILEARRTGYSFSDGEVEIGLCSIAVPIVNGQGKTVAALNATAPSVRAQNKEMNEQFLPLLRQVADDLKLALH